MTSRNLIPRILLISIATAVCASAGETVNKSLMHDGQNRTYSIYIPDSYNGDDALPLVLNFHGWGSNNSQQANLSQMNSVADSEGFLTVYPRSIGTHWNVMQDDSEPRDIDFTESLLDQLESDYAIDRSRVYATGFSNGGSMSFLVGSTLPNRFAAIAPVAATIPVKNDLDEVNVLNPTEAPTSSRAVPVMYMLGTNDPLVAYDGGQSPNSGYWYPATDGVMTAWSTNNSCSSNPDSTTLPDTNTTDRSTVTVVTYGGCEMYTSWDGSEQVEANVVHYRIEGGGHIWPSTFSWPASLGAANRDIKASEEVWSFLSRHTLPYRESLGVCDFDNSGRCEVTDVDALTKIVVDGTNESTFDLNGDSVVDLGDVNEWLSIAATENGFAEPYLLGDADLDGTIGASDLNRVALNWRSAANKWSDGDFNADGRVDAGDLNSVGLNWRQSISAAAATAAVPEPGTEWLTVLGVFVLASATRRQSNKRTANAT